MLALNEVCGFEPAKKSKGVPLPPKHKDRLHNERALGEKVLLSSDDVHFGINGDVSEYISGRRKDSYGRQINIYGPRALDIAVRGGKVAETLWAEFKDKEAEELSDEALKESGEFLESFDEIGEEKKLEGKRKGWKYKTKKMQMVYPKGAKLTRRSKITGRLATESIAGHEKYAKGAKDKTYDHVSKRRDQIGAVFQMGARWSKVAIESTIKKGGTVHFHLDGLESISDILSKKGKYNYNTTARELRYVFRNWHRENFRKSVIFYNGYYKMSDEYRPVIVDPPWS